VDAAPTDLSNLGLVETSGRKVADLGGLGVRGRFAATNLPAALTLVMPIAWRCTVISPSNCATARTMLRKSRSIGQAAIDNQRHVQTLG
jgi:hypothetical protein